MADVICLCNAISCAAAIALMLASIVAQLQETSMSVIIVYWTARQYRPAVTILRRCLAIRGLLQLRDN